ncbi:RNA-binding transcriptional accessory protein [Fulvitalea axinellae]|uniref:RNA-binding transcriptional accessory protein n=1 Tax=Fulvitalea axinellae TaxID=1182444 RepID=A0AAU9CGD1_9BACT|nr:RNA-binding transcriptional accessory protein [Fulvitalea axinellae]
MTNKHISIIADELSVRVDQVSATVDLLDEGATVPFISRYRKEATGSLDEVAVAAVRDRIEQLRELDKRREAILKSLKDQEKLTPELEKAVMEASTMAELEDIYLPYKPKRRTKATIAREKGLEPLAKELFEQGSDMDLEEFAAQFVDEGKEVKDVEEALKGARDIIAEWINEDQEARSEMREFFAKEGTFKARVIPGKEEEGKKYKDYFEWDEPIEKAPSHRVLAMRRAEKEMVIMLDSCPDADEAVDMLDRRFVHGSGPVAEQVATAAKDSYKRLLKPSMETEVRMESKKKADEEAIRVFSENLRELLLAAPLGRKRVMAIDPGFRTGCKVVMLDEQGKLLDHTVIYPTNGQRQQMEAEANVKAYCERFDVEAIAIGNGTASRETESFVNSLGLPKSISVVMVNESGASIYSASEVAREEFPDHDITVRGSVSIGRRLMDPLAELVKLDPKSIGVGQYQHDVDQSALKKGLDDVVVSCVNAVGVEVNTASKELLTYVSGLGPQLAKNIVEYRNENGPFRSRAELKKVPRLGAKAFEQCAGFLRIRGGKNPLDASSVHPERYDLVKKMAKDLGSGVQELLDNDGLRQRVKLSDYVDGEVGLPTLEDIMGELEKPGRDPREAFEAFSFAEGVNEITDLSVGLKLPGIVTNVTNFGAFVDVGVHQDGLVHISHIADRFVSDPAEVVKVSQKVTVTVVDLDVDRRRISLSMKANPFEEKRAPQRNTRNERKRDENRFQPRKTTNRQSPNNRREQDGPDGDLQAKLAMLKGKFKN